jgi:hypothetical protein
LCNTSSCLDKGDEPTRFYLKNLYAVIDSVRGDIDVCCPLARNKDTHRSGNKPPCFHVGAERGELGKYVREEIHFNSSR